MRSAGLGRMTTQSPPFVRPVTRRTKCTPVVRTQWDAIMPLAIGRRARTVVSRGVHAKSETGHIDQLFVVTDEFFEMGARTEVMTAP